MNTEQEPQAQAGEPEVVAWIGVAPRDGRINLVVDKPSPTPMRAFNFQPLIYLHLHREAMAEARSYVEFLDAAIAKKDAALKACVEALKTYDMIDAEAAVAITQAKEAMK